MKKNSTIFLFVLALLSSGAMSIQTTAQTAIGGDTPDPSAMLDVQSTSKGVLFPRMTTAERDLINNPATGLMIFNTTTQCLEINLGAATPLWESIVCPMPLVGALNCGATTFRKFPLLPNVAATNQSFTIPYTGGNGIAHSGQIVTASSTGVTGLTATLLPGTLATGAGSLTYNLEGTPSAFGTASFAIAIGGQTCVLDVPVTCGAYVALNTWKVFMCHNLGADISADPFTPNWKLNGDYYQWGSSTKAADGPIDQNTPNNAAPAGWSSTAPTTSWSDSGLDNNPCPQGFRVPSRAQWEGARASSNLTQPSGATWNIGDNNYDSGVFFGPGLFLPAAGFRDADGVLANRNVQGYYHSSTIDPNTPSRAQLLTISNLNVENPRINTFSRSLGLSVRCIAE